MNPYLEGYLWPDVHQSLASQIKRQLSPLLRPRYVARLAMYFVDGNVPTEEVGIIYPDVEVVHPKSKSPRSIFPTRHVLTKEGMATAPYQSTITPPVLIVPTSISPTIRLTSVHVHDIASNQLVTSIEILSPTNKWRPGLESYRQKRGDLIRSGVHLLEIDLIRRGKRAWELEEQKLPSSAYLVLLTRSEQSYTEVWPIQLREPLPILPVPLCEPDPDVPLDLQQALTTIYEESDYDRTIDYDSPPPRPNFDEEETAWVEEYLHKAGLH
jgi:hypothetical protein